VISKEESLSAEALDVVVQLLFEFDEDPDPDRFYDRICEAICRQTSMRRAVLFLYDRERRLVLPVGSHGVEPEILAHAYGSLEETPIAQRAFAEDAVVETTNLAVDVPARYANLPGLAKLTCTPVAAAGRWLGVVFADRHGEAFELNDEERWTMRALGRTAALASHVREVTRQLERERRLSERIELAREVHERVTQRLFGVSMALGSDRALAAEDRQRCAAEIEAALAELREALLGTGPSPVGPEEGTLRAELDRLGRQYKRLPLRVSWSPDANVPDGLEPLAISVLNEALRNAEKHADPTEVAVSVDAADSTFALEIRNDGLHSNGEGETAGGSRMGLRLASYEALQRGGMLEYGREDDHWRIRLVLPSA
jgi:signal transduction histidine kinase